MALASRSEAVAFYGQAIALQATPARLMGLGQALFDQGNLNEARQAWQDAAAAFERVGGGNRMGVARAYLMISGSYMASGNLI
ncbi:MAG: tetratricopeptide repeat protein [Ardenticatenaceae bacterium]